MKQIPCFGLSASFALSFLTFCFFGSQVSSQNLVPNGSFEEGVTCPSFPGNVTEECVEWFGSVLAEPELIPTPEWYHECSENDAFNPPTVAFGNQFPQEGQGYAGVSAYLVNEPNYREIIGVELTEPLVTGSSYLVEFYISNIAPQNIGIESNKIGFNFSTHPSYNYMQFPINQSHFSVDTIVPISNEWNLISVVFVADSNYSFLHIGNFYDDEQTSISSINEISQYTYYAIDNVSVTQALQADGRRIDSQEIQIFPNPTVESLFIQTDINIDINKIVVIDSRGSVVLVSMLNYPQAVTEINVESLPKGIYTLMLSISNSTYYEKFIKM